MIGSIFLQLGAGDRDALRFPVSARHQLCITACAPEQLRMKAVGMEHRGASTAGHGGDRERGAVEIGVVGQLIGGGEGDWSILDAKAGSLPVILRLSPASCSHVKRRLPPLQRNGRHIVHRDSRYPALPRLLACTSKDRRSRRKRRLLCTKP